jgi:hypothetical protein
MSDEQPVVNQEALAKLEEALNKARKAALDQVHEYENSEEWHLEEATEIAEQYGLKFVYKGPYDERERTYTSLEASGWNPSTSCEWEQSAQFNVDYGWNV